MDSSQALGPQHEWRKGQKIKEESTAMTAKTVRSHKTLHFIVLSSMYKVTYNCNVKRGKQ